MIKDINTIKKELIDYNQVEMPYKFKPNTRIKYITIENNEEYFFTGGKYLRIGNEKIFLQNGPLTWAVPIKIRDDENNILYESKFFIPKNENEIKSKEIIELEKIIKSQQKVIDKMTNTIKEDKIKIHKYENLIKNFKK